MRNLMLAASISAVVLAGPALAGNKGKAPSAPGSKAKAEDVHTLQVVDGLISAAERAIVAGYLDRNRVALPGDLAGAKPLPPGIANKIARGGTLPPGIAKRSLPDGLLAQLPARPGQEWLLVGSDLVVVEIATNVIVDVLKGVL